MDMEENVYRLLKAFFSVKDGVGGYAVVQKETFKYLLALWMPPRFSLTLPLS
jgi:hypothetical protein